MPLKRVAGGFKYGDKGKVFKTKAGAVKQMKAMQASGYKEKPAESKKK